VLTITQTRAERTQLARAVRSCVREIGEREMGGAGVLRFQDGSLLKINLTQGADCIDLAALQGHCTLTLQITGGTGRFKDALGVLTLTERNPRSWPTP